MKYFSTLTLLFAFAAGSLQASGQTRYPFQNPQLPLEQRIDNAISLMTLQEKIDLLGKTLNVPRLGIHGSGSLPSINGSNGQFEGLHGLAVGGPGNWGKKSPGGPGEYSGVSSIPTTQFPQAVGLGETWDPALLQQAAAEEGREARYIFQSYDRGGLIVRAPNADLMRDPRWGRSEESFGEDPFLTGTLATAFVKGLQGNDPRYLLTVSLVKHFMANSNEDSRFRSSSNFDTALLHEYYAAPFRMAFEQGGAEGIMASYNAVNGTPMTTSPLLKSLVMKQWGFKGMVDSDRGAVTFMVTRHHFYPDMDHSVAGAIHAGINQFLNPYRTGLEGALQSGLITQKDIDENLHGVLRGLIKLGDLDPPAANPYTKIKKGLVPVPWNMQTSKSLALRATLESIVLLKNAPVDGSNPLLPLDVSKLKSIAVVGPRADVVDSDGYGGTAPFAITPLQGIKDRIGSSVSVRYAADHDGAVEAAKNSTVAIVLIGSQPMCGEKYGHCSDPSEGEESVDRKQIDLNPQQQKLVEDVYAVNPHTVVVLVSGYPYAIDWTEQHVPAIVHMANSSEQEGKALAEVLFGDYDPAGRLVETWPRSLRQLPPMMDYNLRDGRTYMYFKGSPLYPFGYGLSYTSFKYTAMHLSSSTLARNGEVAVSIDVTNTGKRAGEDVVQLYVQHLNSKVQRPREELEGFERISLAAGEQKTVAFHLPASSLAYWDMHSNQWEVEQDRVRVMVGSTSADIQAEQTLAVSR